MSDAHYAPDPEPSWLVRLRDAVLRRGMLPETDEAFVHEDVPYVCHRAITYDRSTLMYREEWLEPHTYRSQKVWTADLEAGAWAGALPETVFQQQVATLVQWLNALRPRARRIERQPDWQPGRFARPQQRRRG